MIFHRSNYDDIRKYYSNNIIKLPNISGDRLWQITHISPSEVRLVDVDGTEIYIDLEDEYEVDYALPSRAVYQSKDRACMLARRPAKQYSRGLCKENTSLFYYSSGGEVCGYSWNLETLQQFVDKPAYQEVSTINLDEGYSWALNKHMAVSHTGIVLVLSKAVASISWGEKQILSCSSLFKPEVQQAFPGWTFA